MLGYLAELNTRMKKKKVDLLKAYYLICRRGKNLFGLPISNVAQIIESHELQPAIQFPVCSVAMWNNIIFPTVDFREEKDGGFIAGGELCIVVLSIGQVHVGFLVEEVKYMAEFSEDKIFLNQTPAEGMGWEMGFIDSADGKIMLIDIEKAMHSAGNRLAIPTW